MEKKTQQLSGETSLQIGTICGCLKVLDDGSEYMQQAGLEAAGVSKRIIKYKCQCRKCGKTRYYSFETLQTNPHYCYRPIYCSSRFSYSIRVRNGTYHKLRKYEGDETVILVDNKDDVVPSEEYCGKWNAKRKKEIDKKAAEEAAQIAALPRKKADNYDRDFVGLNYESFEILECVDEALEGPTGRDRYGRICGRVVVYKQYRCRCYVCEKEILVKCDQFGIYPPTEYGIRAYDGYWSLLSCDCHPISSFQWIVNKLLFENGVLYRVEYSFPDLLGSYGKNNLRYDYAVLDHGGAVTCLIECQGEQHYKPIKEFGGKYQFAAQQENDRLKRDYAKAHGIPLIEISYKNKKAEKIEAILKENKII